MKKFYIITINTIDQYGYPDKKVEYVNTNKIDEYIKNRKEEIKAIKKWDWYYAKDKNNEPIVYGKEIEVITY